MTTPTAPPRDLPTGTITFCFTDIEGSTQLLREFGGDARYAAALDDHRRLVREAFASHGGAEVDTQGDAFFYAFARASEAVRATVAAQTLLADHQWPEGVPISVRIGLHTGEAIVTSEGYVGLAVHHAARVMSCAHGGQVVVSQTTAELVAASLPDEFALMDLGEHRLKDLSAPVRLYQVVHPALRRDFPHLKTVDYVPNNLPEQPTTFIGRDEELAAVTAACAEARLVTITGVGGTGKTRLALQAGAHLLDVHADGAWFVEFGDLTAGQLVAQQIAATLGVDEEAGRPLLEGLIDALRPKQAVLLVLDTCEHVIAEVAVVARDLLSASAGLRILATSREPLELRGEVVIRLEPLELPEAVVHAPVEVLTNSCVQLFCDRARLVRSDFEPTDEDVRAIAAICRAVDGIPLAIELAAARVRMMPPVQIAERIDDHFKLLRGGSRDSSERQQSLRGAIDWSFELLGTAERLVFCRLSVCSGFNVEAAEAIANCDDVDALDVLELIGRLVDRSLLTADVRGTSARYKMLATIRSYAFEKLTLSGSALEAKEAHLDYFLAAARGPRHLGRERVEAMLPDAENYRAAIGHALDVTDRRGAEIVAALVPFWEAAGHYSEGRHWHEEVVARLRHEDEGMGLALRGLARFAYLQSDFELAGDAFRRALAIAHSNGDDRGRAGALTGLGSLAFATGEVEQATTFFDEALEARRQLGEPVGVAASLYDLATTKLASRTLDEARALSFEGLAIAERAGAPRLAADFQEQLGQIAFGEADFDAAHERFDAALVLHRAEGDNWGIASSLNSLAMVAAELGDHGQAIAWYRESAEILRELGDRASLALTMRAVGQSSAAVGLGEEAALAFRQAADLFDEIGDVAAAELCRAELG